MRTLEQIAVNVRAIVERAVADLGADLGGFSPIDLVMDNIEDRISTRDAQDALVVAGVDSMLSRRCVLAYSRTI